MLKVQEFLIAQKGQGLTNQQVFNQLTEQFFEVNPGARSFPQVWVDDTLIGGYNELVNYLKQS